MKIKLKFKRERDRLNELTKINEAKKPCPFYSSKIKNMDLLESNLDFKNLNGMFIIYNSGTKTANPTSRFLYYNTKTHLIEHCEMHDGKSYYKNFGFFVMKILNKIKLNKNETLVYAPKNFINPSLISYAKNMHNIKLIPFSTSSDKKYQIIYTYIKQHVNGNDVVLNKDLELCVNNFNNNSNQFKPQIYKAFISNVRKYSTLNFKNSNSSNDNLFPNINNSSELLALKEGELDYLHNRYESINKVAPLKDWFNSDPYKFKSLGRLANINSMYKELEKLWETFNPDESYSLLFLVQSVEGDLKTLDRQILVNKSTDIQLVVEIIYAKYDLLISRYGIHNYVKLLCKHRILHGSVKVELNKNNILEEPTKTLEFLKVNTAESLWYTDYYIPLSMDLSVYGKVLETKNNIVKFLYKNSILEVKIIDKGIHEITVKSGSVEFFVEDMYFEGSLIRMVKSGKVCTYFQIYNNKVINVEYEIKTKFITPIKKHAKINTNYATFDIETYQITEDKTKIGWSVPFALGFYNGKKVSKYYATDYKTVDEMLIKCLTSLIVNCKGRTVYAHNLSGFDINIIFKVLNDNFIVKDILSVDNRIISLSVQIKSENKDKQKDMPKITFRDSNKLIPGSLKALGESYNVTVVKGIFPYKFPNKDNLNYKGCIPDIKYYKSDPETILAYKNFAGTHKKYVWNLRAETLKYLDKDLISLYQIIEKFNSEVFEVYGLNVGKYSTISGLSKAVFQSNFMSKEEGCLLSSSRGELDVAIRLAYYGGAVDVYKPHGKGLYYYDFNSLYPYAMTKPMPVGTPTYSKLKDLNKIFGFVKVTVTTPDDIFAPVLPYKATIKGSQTLIFPKGTWTGWYFSEEIKNAVENFGYKVVVHESYIYQKNYNIFHKFVQKLGTIKQTSVGERRSIAKLIMNSLYGRMGMHQDRDIIDIVGNEELDFILKSHHVIDYFGLNSNANFVRYKAKPDQSICEMSGINFEELLIKHDIKFDRANNSVAVAAATTAWGRILMSPLRVIPDNTFFYGDTDSAILSKKLPDNMIGNKIGDLKLEYPLIEEAWFISPKLYYLTTSEGVIIKNKGYSGKLSLEDFNTLYGGGSIPTLSPRFKPQLEHSTVVIYDQEINISSQFNKRNKLISNGIWVDTSPHCVYNGKISPLDLIQNPQKSLINFEFDKSWTLILTLSQNLFLDVYTPDNNCSLILYTKPDYFLTAYLELNNLSLIPYKSETNFSLIIYNLCANFCITLYIQPVNSVVLYNDPLNINYNLF